MHPQHNEVPSRDGHEDATQQGTQDCFSDVGTDQPARLAGNVLEEHEPRLKYHRLGADAEADSLLAEDAATCLCVSDKLLALGTKSGTVLILDYSGDKVEHGGWTMLFIHCLLQRMHCLLQRSLQAATPWLWPQCHCCITVPWLVQVNQFNVHKGAVHDLSFDETVEFVASCSEDCTVQVSCLSCTSPTMPARQGPTCADLGVMEACIPATRSVPAADVHGVLRRWSMASCRCTACIPRRSSPSSTVSPSWWAARLSATLLPSAEAATLAASAASVLTRGFCCYRAMQLDGCPFLPCPRNSNLCCCRALL